MAGYQKNVTPGPRSGPSIPAYVPGQKNPNYTSTGVPVGKNPGYTSDGTPIGGSTNVYIPPTDVVTNDPAPATPTPTPSPAAPNPLFAQLRADFPWLDQIGLDPAFFQNLVATAASADEVLVKLRDNPVYKARFPGLWRGDGSIRMNEAQYIQQEGSYRQLLQQFGYGDEYKTPQSLIGIFDSEMDPNELGQRLQTYRGIQDSGQGVKDAFYVYAGINLTDDDLYQATVDPGHAQALSQAYNANVASSSFDYSTWITRATEVGLKRVADTLTTAQKSGALTGAAVQAVLRTDSNFARTIMDAIYTNSGASNQTLNLEELISSFQEAAIGSAATGAGLSLPSKERIAELRTAGVDRARAMQSYGQYGAQGDVYRAASQRAGLGVFDQKAFEDAAFLGNGAAQQRLSTGLAREDAAGHQTGSFGIDQGTNGRYRQQGLRPL